MTLREACDELKKLGCTNVWSLMILQRPVNPVRSIYETDGPWIDRVAESQTKLNPGKYELVGRRICFIPTATPDRRVHLWVGA